MNTSINEMTSLASLIAKVLSGFNLKFTEIKVASGPSFTLFKVVPAPETKVSAFKKLEADIEISLGTKIRITTMPDCIGIEVPVKDSTPVLLHNCVRDENWLVEQEYSLPIILGKDVYHRLWIMDLSAFPHLLVAGTTKQEKTAFLRTLIMSLIWKKKSEDLKFVLLNPKGTEFKQLEVLKNNYLATLPDGESESEEKEGCIATDPTRSEQMLSALCLELENRYELLQKAGTREIKSYNNKLEKGGITPEDGHFHLPYIVCICDEYADLVMGTNKISQKSIKDSIIRLAQKGRAVGIHMIISTQRPCTDIITGLIKVNFPVRASFRVASRVDSMSVLDCPGAEKLSGNGDMLFSMGMECERVQVPYYAEDEMTDELRTLAGNGKGDAPYYLPVGMETDNTMEQDDPLYDAAKSLVIMTQSCSQTMLQRKLGIGFARASRLVDMLKDDGLIVGEAGQYEVIKKSMG